MYVCMYKQVIYVDSDQVIRSDLKELWDMDLQVHTYILIHTLLFTCMYVGQAICVHTVLHFEQGDARISVLVSGLLEGPPAG